MFVIWTVFCLGVLGEIVALHTPPYIKACSRSDPKLDECALQSGRNAIAQLVKGDPAYQIPAMNPMFIKAVHFQATPSINMSLYNVSVQGLELAELRQMKINLSDQSINMTIFSTNLQIIGQYSMTGHILVLPLNGKGNANITIKDGSYHYNIRYGLLNKKGIEHIDITNHTLKINCKRAFYQFDNLFNGNEQLSNQIQQVFEENWRQVNTDFLPLIEETIDRLATLIVNSILNRVPYDEVFLK